MNRQEYLAWAKQRALEYVGIGELKNAVVSMLSDLAKHPELEAPPFLAFAGMLEITHGAGAVRHWIEGFN